MDSMESIPEIGKTYMFYDDGKISRCRQDRARVLRVITKEDAKEISFPTYYDDDFIFTTIKQDTEPIGSISLYDIWLLSKMEGDWIFANDTDCFIECSIPKYDENTIWFVRTKLGGWFSMDIQNEWQGGRLDVSGELTKMLKI
jgi:hypothetical protein